MDINDIENSLNNLQADSNKVLAIIFEMTIRNQAYLEELRFLQTQTMVDISEGEVSFKDTYEESEKNIEKRALELRASLVSRIL